MLAKSTLFSFCSRAIFFYPKIAFLAPRQRFSPPGSLLRHGTSRFDLRIPTVNSHETAFWGLSFMYQPAHKISGAFYRVIFRYVSSTSFGRGTIAAAVFARLRSVDVDLAGLLRGWAGSQSSISLPLPSLTRGGMNCVHAFSLLHHALGRTRLCISQLMPQLAAAA